MNKVLALLILMVFAVGDLGAKDYSTEITAYKAEYLEPEVTAHDCEAFNGKVMALRAEYSDSIIADKAVVSLAEWNKRKTPEEDDFVNICCYYSYDNPFEDYSEGITGYLYDLLSDPANCKLLESHLDCLERPIRDAVLSRMISNLSFEAFVANFEERTPKASAVEIQKYIVDKFPFIRKYGMEGCVLEVLSEN